MIHIQHVPPLEDKLRAETRQLVTVMVQAAAVARWRRCALNPAPLWNEAPTLSTVVLPTNQASLWLLPAGMDSNSHHPPGPQRRTDGSLSGTFRVTSSFSF